MFAFTERKSQQTVNAQDHTATNIRLKQGLSKTRAGLFGRLIARLGKRGAIDAQALEEIEEQLLMADVGAETTELILVALRQQRYEQIDYMDALKEILLRQLESAEQALSFPDKAPTPHIILVVGVNGVGKTTTIGKLSSHLIKQNKKVQLIAGDTFRAAAIEQLQAWGARNHIEVTAQHPGTDPGAVIFDGLQSARANQADLVIADTAGRLHTNQNLMAELKKIHRVVHKFEPNIHCEVILVLDAGTGQNALTQALTFDQAIGIDSIILTKLDGTAKGGILFSLSEKLHKPVRFIGVGEQVEDLYPFIASRFVDALLATTI